MNKLITKYISLLKIEDIKKFGIKNNIFLSDKELNYTYNIIKNKHKELIDNQEDIFIEAKKYIDENKLIKIERLFYEYKKRYKNYL